MIARRLAVSLAALVASSLTACDGSAPPAGASATHPDASLISAAAPMLEGRSWLAGTVLADGRVLVAGGDATSKHAEIFDPQANAWTATPPLTELWTYHTALTLPDGRALLARLDR